MGPKQKGKWQQKTKAKQFQSKCQRNCSFPTSHWHPFSLYIYIYVHVYYSATSWLSRISNEEMAPLCLRCSAQWKTGLSSSFLKARFYYFNKKINYNIHSSL